MIRRPFLALDGAKPQRKRELEPTSLSSSSSSNLERLGIAGGDDGGVLSSSLLSKKTFLIRSSFKVLARKQICGEAVAPVQLDSGSEDSYLWQEP